MTDVDVSQLSYAQLVALKQKLDGEIGAKRAEELKVLVDGFAKKLEALGFTADEAIDALGPYTDGRSRKSAKARAPATPQVPFYDPANPTRRWSGHGRAPQWLKDYEAAGRNREEFRVVRVLDDDGAATPV